MTNKSVKNFLDKKYQYGFVTDIKSEFFPYGLNEEIIHLLSQKKKEPEFMLKWRIESYNIWKKMRMPNWQKLKINPINYQNIKYYSSPLNQKNPKNLNEVDPKIIETYNKLGIPIAEQKWLSGIAVDVIFDSVSITTTFKEKLSKKGIIFCSISEAIKKHPELIQKYLGSVVPKKDNFFAALNSAVFSDGSFVYIPKDTRCPMELSSYFRINTEKTGQFERTLIISEDNSYVSYLEGCTAPTRDENQLHAAVVEIVALKNAQVKYSTVQNWYPGDINGKGGIYNFVTKRGLCKGNNSNISWTQIETGSSITWKYPSVILKGDNSIGEFYSVALTSKKQQADTGTKMIHLGKNTSSTIVSKGISSEKGQNSYRGLVRISPTATNSRNFTQCDSLILSNTCSAHTFPYIEVKNPSSIVEHEASTSKISEEQLFYLLQRGINEEESVSLIVNGFCRKVFKKLPMEFAMEAQKLMEISLEGSVG
uniref:Cysteine desulfurase activator complex subunit SufB FeS assembly SUF system regulator n=1 Tax=Candidatus Endecteinascidia fromenterensis TaxID=266021 RepID=G8D479_9GAMM|nr:cysteine desulfurase activator complex subunit SufB FeS assembly SUF system regulator [Candidatus Endoecteinascidia frumentensis]